MQMFSLKCQVFLVVDIHKKYVLSFLSHIGNHFKPSLYILGEKISFLSTHPEYKKQI